MSKSASERRLIAQSAQEYEEFASLAFIGYVAMQKELGDVVARYCKKSNEKFINIVEIGTSTGATSERILTQDKRISLVTIDKVTEMHEYIKDRLARFAKEASLVNGDFQIELAKIATGSVSMVVSCTTIHDMPSAYRTNLMTQIWRVLKPDGVFLNADKIASSNQAIYHLELTAELRQICCALANEPALALEWVVHFLNDDKDPLYVDPFIGDLHRLGFKSVAVTKRYGTNKILFAQKPK